MGQQRAYQSLTQPYVNKLTYCVQRALQCKRHMMLTSADAHPLPPHHFVSEESASAPVNQFVIRHAIAGRNSIVPFTIMAPD